MTTKDRYFKKFSVATILAACAIYLIGCGEKAPEPGKGQTPPPAPSGAPTGTTPMPTQ